MSDTWGMTTPRPMKMSHTSTMGSNRITMGGTINPARKELIIITIQISIPINSP